MTDVGKLVEFTDSSDDSKVTQNWTNGSKDLIVECKKDIYFKVNNKASEVARFIYDGAQSAVAVALSGGLRWGTGAPPSAAAYFHGATSKLIIEIPSGAQVALSSSVMELNSADLDLDDNKKLKWGISADIYFDSANSKLVIEKGAQVTLATGAMELNSADLDLDSGKKLKWGNQAELISNSGGMLELNSADLDFDSQKGLKWMCGAAQNPYANIYYDHSDSGTLYLKKESGAVMTLSGSQARFVSTNVVLDNTSYLYLNGTATDVYVRHDNANSRVEFCLGSGKMLRLGGTPHWVEMTARDSRYFFHNLTIEDVSSDPSSAGLLGQMLLTVSNNKLWIYNGTNWKYVSLS